MVENDRVTYIYALVDPRDGGIYYIGKANDLEKRLYQHLRRDVNRHKCRWLESLARDGLAPTVRILETVPADEWAEAEIKWIAKGRGEGWPLTNIAAGGPHCHDPYALLEQVLDSAQWLAFSALPKTTKTETMIAGAQAALPFLHAWANGEEETLADWHTIGPLMKEALCVAIQRSGKGAEDGNERR